LQLGILIFLEKLILAQKDKSCSHSVGEIGYRGQFYQPFGANALAVIILHNLVSPTKLYTQPFQ